MLKMDLPSFVRLAGCRASAGIVAALGLVTGLLVGAPGCTRTCSLALCSAGVSILFEPEGETLDDGAYDIILETEMQRIEIHCVVDGSASACQEPTFEGSEPDPNIEVHADVLTLGEDSVPRSLVVSISHVDEQESLGLDRVDVTVMRDGELRAEETLEPEYERREINGPGCGWCESAEDQHVAI